MAVLDARGLVVAVRRRRTRPFAPVTNARIITGVDLEIPASKVLGLVGESGSGKSTAARAALRLIPLEAGTIELDGSDITTLPERALRLHRRKAQMVFQDPYSSLDPAMAVGDIIGEGLKPLGAKPRERRARARELLELVGLRAGHADRYPAEFSGGQRQRIAIARALAPSPKLLVCDEAVSALDVSTQNSILDMLQSLGEELGLAMLFISHDLSVVRRLAHTTSVMYCGEVVETGPTSALLSASCHPFTVALASAVPVPAPRRQRARQRMLLEGDMPNSLDPPRGCRFHPRCPIAMDICREESPEQVPTAYGGTVRCHAHTTGPTLGGESVVAEVLRAASERLDGRASTAVETSV